MQQQFAEKLRSHFAQHTLFFDEPMSRHTTFRVGGPADALFQPREAEEIAGAIRLCKEWGENWMVIGNGSNLLVSDEGYRGLIIQLGEKFAEYAFEDTKVKAQAGLKLTTLSRESIQKDLGGLEFAGGIPGTIGGAVFMNAGAYGGCMENVLRSVTYLTAAGNIEKIPARECCFGYRSSIFSRENWTVLEAEFSLERDADGQARQRYDEFNRRRREKQPLSQPSAGSVFKRPEGQYAGALIEAAGLKGACVGGAQVSEKHANFIVNAGGASAADIRALIEHVQKTVQQHSGFYLEPEVRFVGF